MRGRTDKYGTLLNFHDVFAPLVPLPYSVRALSRVALLSITRGDLKTLLTTYTDDKPVFMKAIEHAKATIEGGSRRACTRADTSQKLTPRDNLKDELKDELKQATKGATTTSPRNAWQSPRGGTECDRYSAAEEPSSTDVVQLHDGVSGVLVDQMQRKIDALTRLCVVQAKMMRVVMDKQNGLTEDENGAEEKQSPKGHSGCSRRRSSYYSEGAVVNELDQLINSAGVLAGS
jgi:hypothetical protein